MTISQLYDCFLACNGVSTDTRQITEDCLFVALRGDKFDGNQYAKEALEKGAKYAIVDNSDFAVDNRYLLVDNSLEALQQLAHYHRKQLNIPIVGLTGSNGKTTTKELIAVVLNKKYKTYATKGNLNNHIGVPLTLLAIDRSYEIAVVEMGANHQKEIELLCSIAEPTHGLITNIGKAHLEGFGGIEGVRKGKGELYDWLVDSRGTVFVNAVNPTLSEMAQERNFTESVMYLLDSDTLQMLESSPFVSYQGIILKILQPLWQLESTLACPPMKLTKPSLTTIQPITVLKSSKKVQIPLLWMPTMPIHRPWLPLLKTSANSRPSVKW
jgi:UDP-N-acetylmuramoyl-tripeptide--D-alanyl-D-alanine ligase